MKRNIVLTTDSGMCPNKDYNPIIIPDQITRSDGNCFVDNDNDITTDFILKDENNTYRTSAPLLTDYTETFVKLLEDGNDIIHLSLGSGISSSSVNNANLVANELNNNYDNKVYVIDSCTGSVGGTCYYEACYQELISNEYANAFELKNKLEKLKTRIKTSFYVPDPTGYLRSGRDSSSKYSFSQSVLSLSSSILKKVSFKFRVDFYENGDLYLKKIFRSSNKNGMLDMTKAIVNKTTLSDFSNDFCVIGDLHQKDVNMKELEDYILSLNHFKRVVHSNVGNVVAPYGCDDLCGLSLIKKK